jgi:hypothetical protein
MTRPAVIFDTEYTTWEGAYANGWTGPGQHREIVQISAVKIDFPSCKIIDSFDILVKPKLNPVLSDFFQELTQISQELVDLNGVPFETALGYFLEFCGPGTPTMSYGNDACILAENIALARCNPGVFYGFGTPNFMNLGHALVAADPSLETKKINSGKLWAHFGLEKPNVPGAEHNALFDCYSIVAALKFLVGKRVLAL